MNAQQQQENDLDMARSAYEATKEEITEIQEELRDIIACYGEYECMDYWIKKRFTSLSKHLDYLNNGPLVHLQTEIDSLLSEEK